jgi:hypothetical protein
MHTQHVKFSTYVLCGGGVGVVFEDGEEAAGLVDDDDVNGSMFEPVAVMVLFSPSTLFFVLLLVLLLDFMGTVYSRAGSTKCFYLFRGTCSANY